MQTRHHNRQGGAAGRLLCDMNPIVASPHVFGYRNKVSLQTCFVHVFCSFFVSAAGALIAGRPRVWLPQQGEFADYNNVSAIEACIALHSTRH
jgi:hypothetical protein